MANPTAAVQAYTVPSTQEKISRGLAATVQTYYPNEMIGLDTAGNATKFDDAAKLQFDGLVGDSVRVDVLTGDAAGDREVESIRPRYFSMTIASAAATDVGRPVYAAFSNQVQFTKGTYANLVGYVARFINSTEVLIRPEFNSVLAVRAPTTGVTNADGYTIPIKAGDANGTGADGVVQVGSPLVERMTQTAETDTATITVAELLTKVIDGTPTAAATYTLPTAALLVAGIPGAEVGDSFEFVVNNKAAGADTITLAAGSGGTDDGTLTVAQNVIRAFKIIVTNVTAASEAYLLYGIG